jgi:ABC-type transport system involved in cytochrome bd biosynthesis fused ATPase/permease subunit
MKKYTFDREAYMASTSYKISNKILHIPQWVLAGISITLSIIQGVLNTKAADVMRSVTTGDVELPTVLAVYVIVNLGMTIAQFISMNALKAFRLNTVNASFLKEYERVFNSRTQDISRVGPAKIEGAINSAAVMTSNIRAEIITMIMVIVPFAITIFNVALINLYAALGIVAIMAAAVLLSVNGDRWFHFNENASQMKGEMRSVSVNNFIVVRMLKYMGAHAYASARQKKCQDDATPSFHNESRMIYNGVLELLYNLPILLALWVAIADNNVGLAIFIAMNEYTVSSMIGRISTITELMSERSGELKVLEPLKGDDIRIDQKPAMPEKMVLEGVEFYYTSDKDHRTPFKIPHFEIEKGKRYRFSGPSGAGKSSFFKYFAGEMEANKSFDVRTFYIHQRSELVYGTVRENLTLGNQWVPDPVLEELIRDVKLDQWFKTLPNGLDTVIGKDIEPSGGEQSRISLLRLFVHLRNYGPEGSKPITDEVIILDEVTSALDKRDVFIGENDLSTEEAVIKVIDRETKGSTMFVISHEDVSSKSFGFKDIIDVQMIVSIKGNVRILREM